MQTYEIKLSVPSSFITPWHADTIFGHLCWVAERNSGFSNFSGAAGLIALYRTGNPPLIISDAFPTGFVPAPANLKDFFDSLNTDELDVSRYSLLKKIKDVEYITLDQFKQFRAGNVFAVDNVEKQMVSAITMHNQINRFTNTTGDSGSLYEQDERFVRDGKLSIYARIAKGYEADVEKLFRLFADGGFGKKKSTGKGAFTLESFEEKNDLFDTPGATNSFVVLSHFVPAHDDPTDGVYKTMVKYGKLGEEKALGGNPYKKPLVMLKPGAVFRSDTLKPYCGRMIQATERIAYADEDVVQYGYGFTAQIAMV